MGMKTIPSDPLASRKPPLSRQSEFASLHVAGGKDWVLYFILLAATLMCLLPFAGRAFSTDDPLFIWTAQHIVQQPLNPYGFEVNWNKTAAAMSDVTQNPPLAAYYMAAAGKIGGWSERALHLAFLLPTIALVLGVYRLAKRFTSSPGVAAIATLVAPAFLVSACSVMCDPMMLALWIWAVIFWIEGVDSVKPVFLAASVILLAAGALTKYFGAALVPLLFVYTLARQRRLGSWALVFDISTFGSRRIRICNRENLWPRAAGRGSTVFARSSFVDPCQQRGADPDHAQLHGRQRSCPRCCWPHSSGRESKSP